ncbi:hypothetical protein BJ322DRAFT_1076985 [Thelephora terrestris]|uniref:F-box domain-containing protein n=1 Tax=Thelephora terrestris TaxID=56493 RepID=A0A9P6H8X4_9AGAM|nr:hypothetical protein BJ322DRAFT_1076985 [Thelephora terrestris]
MFASSSGNSLPRNRLLAYQPIVSSEAKPGPLHHNTKGQAPSGRNVGKLAGLLKMPPDVFREIVSDLHPMDILHLARTSLNIRAILMSRDSAHIWATARSVVGMPECPPDLSEPQYASLMFERTCFACGSTRAMRRSAQLKVRFCGSCWKENVKTSHELGAALMPKFSPKDYVLDLLPSSDDVYVVASRLSRCSFYKPEYDAVLKHYGELKESGRLLSLLAFKKERQEFVRQCFEFGRDVDSWWRVYSAKRSAENEKVREHKNEDKQERKNFVHAKLIEAGYAAEDFPVSNSEWEKTVTKRVKLTDKYWSSKMLPRLKVMIEAEQARKEEIKRKERLHQRYLEFAKIYISRGVHENEPEEGPFMMPSYGIFKNDPRVQALLMEDDCRVPFTEERYEPIEDLIAEGAIRYNICARQDLARMHGLYVLHRGDEEETDEFIIKPFLARATTVFHLNSSAAPSCLSYQTLTEIFHLSLVYWMPEVGDPPPWRAVTLDITPDILAGKITRELLRVAGASEVSTWEQMERICGSKLVCTCRKPHFQQPVEITTLIKHIRHERTWESLSEAERWGDEGREDGSDSHIDHAVSEIHNFVKVLPEGMSVDAFMRTQPPLLGGTVGNLNRVHHRSPMMSLILGLIDPPVEEKMFVCAHCGSTMTKEFLVWHMNAKHDKVARQSDVLFWTFSPEILRRALDRLDYADEDDLEDDTGLLIESIINGDESS